MASFLDLESMEGEATPPICTSRFVFGCELNSIVRSYTFRVSEEDDSKHFLALNMACLSEDAKDECNVVEVVGRDYQNKEVAVPVANLKLSCQPWLCLDNFEVQPPVTFRLCSGSGPVHLSGQHQIFHRKEVSDDGFSDDDDDEEESIDQEEELSPIKPAKKKQKS